MYKQQNALIQQRKNDTNIRKLQIEEQNDFDESKLFSKSPRNKDNLVDNEEINQ